MWNRARQQYAMVDGMAAVLLAMMEIPRATPNSRCLVCTAISSVDSSGAGALPSLDFRAIVPVFRCLLFNSTLGGLRYLNADLQYGKRALLWSDQTCGPWLS